MSARVHSGWPTAASSRQSYRRELDRAAAAEAPLVEVLTRRKREEVLRALDDLARSVWRDVAGCDGATFTSIEIGKATTLAATHDHVRALDSVQYTANSGPCVSAMREGRTVRVAEFQTETRWPLVDPAFRTAGVRSSLSLPLSENGETIGGLNMYGAKPAAFTEHSQRAAVTFARQAVVFLCFLQQLHNERSADARAHDIATTLQRSLLAPLPVIAGLDSAARYLVSSEHAEVGGDWYDLFATADGSYGLAVGDVMGHDIAAAAAMGQLRGILRAYASDGLAPPLVLDRLEWLVNDSEMARLATCFHGRITFDTAGLASLQYANAGHVPPLLRGPDGTVRRLDAATSPLLGASTSGMERQASAATLDPGSGLVLYSDGLVKTRLSDIDDRIDNMSAFLAALPTGLGAEQVCDELIATFGATPQDDDVAVLVVTVDAP